MTNERNRFEGGVRLMTPAAVGQRLAVARCERGWTQAAIAATAGITRPQLANIEAGRSWPSVETFAHLCRAIGVRMDEMFWGEW